jgi:hypothetical protein
MDVLAWRSKNHWHKVWVRVKHPWPFYKKAGSISAIVNRADGSVEDLGKVSTLYARRWGVGGGWSGRSK